MKIHSIPFSVNQIFAVAYILFGQILAAHIVATAPAVESANLKLRQLLRRFLAVLRLAQSIP